MASPAGRPKAVLFDVGGVVVLSPFQAILEFEREKGIPTGYINFAIQQGPALTGAWQLLERGEEELNDQWFDMFKDQLERPQSWRAFCVRLEEDRGKNELSSSSHSSCQLPQTLNIDAKSLFWRMMRISRKPDPYIYSALKKIKASKSFIVGALSNTVAFSDTINDDHGVPFDKGLVLPQAPHPDANDPKDITWLFDVFISSSKVGIRKPEHAIYELALDEIREVGRTRGLDSISEADILFLDDIGTNLKSARQIGFRTIKVKLGRTKDAVEELQTILEMPLMVSPSML